MSEGHRLLTGIPASPGVAIARAFIFNRRFETVYVRDIPPDQEDEEIARFRKAVTETLEDLNLLQQRIASDIGEEAAQIFRAHQAVLEDPEVVGVTIARIRQEHKNAEFIFDDVMQGWITSMSAISNPFFRERIADFEDVRYRIMARMLGETPLPAKAFDHPVILVAHNLSPSDTAEIDRKWVRGFITDAGGKTSHTAIVARGLAIPAVVGVKVATQEITDGVMIIIDGTAGLVHIDPDRKTIRQYEETLRRLSYADEERRTLQHLPAVTQDGHTVELSANIEIPEEVEAVVSYGADSVGLYRTEFLYLLQHGLPSEEYQYQAYRTITERLHPKPVIIRTLDLGADKMPLSGTPEANPALGNRGVRLCLNRPELFKVQLRAILRASVAGNLRIMFPMISSLGEIQQAKAILQETREELDREGAPYDANLSVGIMIEVPSAALTARELASEVDFFSIGTNDLIQYTLAVDRGNASVAALYDPFHPAVLRLIASIVEAAHEGNIWVGVCGAMAGDPMTACILLGLGLDELSMSPIDIPEIKKLIRSMKYARMQTIARRALSLSTSEAIRQYLQKSFEA